jgi:hypothetical protein
VDQTAPLTQDQAVPVVNSLHFLLGPVVAAAALGVIVLICRWVFSTDGRDERTARRLEKALSTRDYGLLVPVATVRTRDDADMLRGVLLDAGLRASVSADPEDPAVLEVLVFARDLDQARRLVSAS